MQAKGCFHGYVLVASFRGKRGQNGICRFHLLTYHLSDDPVGEPCILNTEFQQHLTGNKHQTKHLTALSFVPVRG